MLVDPLTGVPAGLLTIVTAGATYVHKHKQTYLLIIYMNTLTSSYNSWNTDNRGYYHLKQVDIPMSKNQTLQILYHID